VRRGDGSRQQDGRWLLRHCRPALFAAAVIGRGWSADTPADWRLPPLDGELAGEFDAVLLGGAPKVKWKATFRTANPRERRIDFSIEGHGLRVRGGARVDPMGEGDWRVVESEIDLGVWFGWIAPKAMPATGAASFSGTMRATGNGTWRAGVLGGQASLSLRDGRIEDVKRAMLLEGISVDVEIADLAARRTEPEQVFTWSSGRYEKIPLGVGRIEFMLEGDQVRVNNAAFDLFGGELRVGSLVMSTARPEFSVDAEMIGVEVGRILFLLPPILSEASGRLDGHVALRRDASGVTISGAQLALREGETADLRLMPTPGVLSSSLPAKVHALYPGLAKMEMGGIPLRAEVLELRYTPARDALGRTASAHVVGRPADPGFKGPVDLTINVRGPVDQLVNLGASSAMRLMGGK